ncbi:MAG: nucleotidyltransferase domain-containing protein [Nanoarchaeota archaeon]
MKDVIDSSNLSPPEDKLKIIKKEVNDLLIIIKNVLRKEKIKAEIFVGGSYAKQTLMRKDNYDIDVYVRFDKKYEKISDLLERVIKKSKLNFVKVHGSRDYFQIQKDNGLLFEIIPVRKISKPNEAENVTDLSYLHVNYVKKNINEKIKREILIMKAFCVANNCYGAESYVRGFSGYAIECLLIHYKGFNKTLKELCKSEDKLYLDGKKHYKNKNDISIQMNESKQRSPVVLVDPTFKERNVLSALSEETFRKFQKVASNYLKNPSAKYFEIKILDLGKLEGKADKNKGQLLKIKLETHKQAGDIAGAKLVKASNYIEDNLKKFFDILNKEFQYDEAQNAELYLIVKPKKEVVLTGPPIEMTKHASVFKKAHKKTYAHKGRLYTKLEVPQNALHYTSHFLDKNKHHFTGMDVVKLEVN